nr:3'-5' exonuclease [Methanobrevibacter sp.]
MKVVYFDTETSGLDCRDCKIIELAMLTVENGEIVDDYDEFVNIGEAISPKITKVTGITNDMLRTEGLKEEVVAADIRKKISPGTLMVAHNAQFDLSFVFHLLSRHFPDEAFEIVRNAKWLDTLTVLKDRKRYPHKLIDGVKHYDIDPVNFHRAIDDTKALYDLTLAMKDERDDLGEYINIFGYNPKYGVSGLRFPFIKYKPHYYQNVGLLPEDRILPKK